MKKLTKLFIALLIPFSAHTQTTVRSADSIIRAGMKATGVVGLSAAIVSDKDIIWSGGYGYADKEREVPYTVNTVMNIGSISKPITGICIMSAVQEGKLSLDEDINKYLPFKVSNPKFPGMKISMRQLVTHTASIRDNDPAYGDSAYYYGGDARKTLDSYLKDYLVPGGKLYADTNFLKDKPGSRYDYSNVGAGLAGYIVERVTGMKLNQYSKKILFQPLGLKNTGWFFSEVDSNTHARLYVRKGNNIARIPFYGLVTYPDGGVRTSVSDLSSILLTFVNHGTYKGKQILNRAMAETLWKPNFIAPGPAGYDLNNENEGIFWGWTGGNHQIGHIGRDPGVNTYMYYNPELKRGVILFYNTEIAYAERQKLNGVFDELWKLAKTL